MKRGAIFVHSSGLSSRQWRRWLPAFPDREHVALDLHGCGARPRWSGPWPFRLQWDLDLVVAAIDAQPGPVHLVGHSYGGSLCCFAALERPARVCSVSAFEPPLMGILRSEGRVADGVVVQPDGVAPGSEAWLRWFVDWWNGPGAYDSLAAPIRDELLATAPKVSGEVADLVADVRPLGAYRAAGTPILVVGGTVSPASIGEALDLLGTLPHVTREVVPGAPHMAPLLAPDPLAARFARFVADHDPA